MDREASPSHGPQRNEEMARDWMNVRVRAEQIAPLLTLAHAQGISPGMVIQEALSRHLASHEMFIEAASVATRDALTKGEYHLQDVVTEYMNGQEIPGSPADCVTVMDLRGAVRRWNRNMEHLLGHRLEDRSLQAMQMVPVEVRDSFAALFARASLGENLAEIELQFIHKDGHPVDVIVSLSPWIQQGEITGVVAISRDVSALKRRERDAAYVATVARACNSAVSGALLLADVAKLTAAWANAARIFTFTDEVARLIVCEVVRPSGDAQTRTYLEEERVLHPATVAEWDVFTTGAPIVREIRDDEAIRSSESGNSYVTIASVPISSEGEAVGTLSAMRRNDTPPFDTQTVATLALVSEQVGLAITKVRLLEQIQEQLEALEKAIRYKDDFLAALSHELRTPLSAILGFAVMIVENDTMGFMRRREMAADIVASAALMRSLVNDLLNLVQIREGQLIIQSEAVELSPLLQLCLRLLMPLMTVKQQTVVTRIPENLPQVRAERTRLEQVILNLLINANKYTLPEGMITVDVAVDGQFVMVSVHDTGVGVSAEDLERVFELFERGETEYSRAQGGAGIGLAVSRQIVEAMEGTLTMESVLGRGSTFTVRLPSA